MELVMANRNINILQAVNQYGKQLVGYIRRQVPTNEDAEDILQDVWYQFSNLAEIDTLESISGWLYRVAKNKITDRFRKKKSRPIEDYAYQGEEGETLFRKILQTDAHTPEEEYLKNIFWDELMKALDEMPEKQRNVFIQNELEDITLQEIANQTGENIKTIISRKTYAVRFLRERLNAVYRDFFD